MLLSLGVAPVGLPAPAWYTSGIVELPLPSGVVDVGLLFQPNYDLLYELRPDLIVVTPTHASVRALFEPPTLTLARLPDANLLWIGRSNPARLQGNVIWQRFPFS